MAAPNPATTEWVPVWNPASGGGGGGGGADLTYLGDYTPATYNSGDIVVAADNVAYMCVKDGTATPPEAWPGSSGGVVGLHALTHEPGGTDPITNLSASVLTSGTVPVARLGAGVTTFISRTDTGTVNDWNVSLTGDTVIRWAGAADLTITGLAGGIAGRYVTIKNVGSGIIYCSYYSSSSITANRFDNLVTSGPLPIASHGNVTFFHNGSYWDQIAHEQGAWITPPFNAANFKADTGTWTVAAGSVGACRYVLRGKSLTFNLYINGSSATGGQSALIVNKGAFGGYTLAADVVGIFQQIHDGGSSFSAYINAGSAYPDIYISKYAGAFAVQASNLAVRGIVTFEVQ